jgi:hypothetical protein
MRVFLVEKVIGKKLEPIAIETNWTIAFGLIKADDVGIITEMNLREVYPDGIGVCQHWHFDPNEKYEDGSRLDADQEGRPKKPRKRVEGI